jgi:hypothetical protein
MKLIFLTTLLASFAQAADLPQSSASAPKSRSLADLAFAAVPLKDWVQGKYAADVGIDSLGSSMTVLAYKLVHFFDSSNAAIEGLREMIALKSVQSDHKIMELLRQPIVESGSYGTLMDLIITSLKKAEFPDQLGDARKQFMSFMSMLFRDQLKQNTDIVSMSVRGLGGIVRLIGFPRTGGIKKRPVVELLPVLLIKDVPDTLDRLGLWTELTPCISKDIIHYRDYVILSEVMAIMHGMRSKQEYLLKVLKDSIEGLVKSPSPSNVFYPNLLYSAAQPAGALWSLRPDLRTELVKLCPTKWRSSDGSSYVGEFYKAVFSKDLNWEENVYRSKVDKAAIKCILQSPIFGWLQVPSFMGKGVLEVGDDFPFYMLTSKVTPYRSTFKSAEYGIDIGDEFGFFPKSIKSDSDEDDQLHKAIDKAHRYLFGDLKSAGLGLFAAYIEQISVYQVVPREPFKQ